MILVPLRIDSKSPELTEYASEVLDEVVPDAVVRRCRADGGFILVTILHDSVHEVVCQTPHTKQSLANPTELKRVHPIEPGCRSGSASHQ